MAMTKADAWKEAKTRWGSDGWSSTASGTCQVGIGQIVAGDALSWEKAFELADDSIMLAGYIRMCGRLEQAKRSEVMA